MVCAVGRAMPLTRPTTVRGYMITARRDVRVSTAYNAYLSYSFLKRICLQILCVNGYTAKCTDKERNSIYGKKSKPFFSFTAWLL